MFTDNIEPIISNGVATICGKDLITKGIGTVRWSWTNYRGKLCTNKFNNVLYFPDSTVTILSATALYESMKDYEVTWVLTIRKYSSFTCYFGKYKKSIAHTENCLPKLEIQSGFSKFSGFYKIVGSI